MLFTTFIKGGMPDMSALAGMMGGGGGGNCYVTVIFNQSNIAIQCIETLNSTVRQQCFLLIYLLYHNSEYMQQQEVVYAV
jgi:ABC-type methionine transport system permease subunit